jgi:hypothetical protein
LFSGIESAAAGAGWMTWGGRSYLAARVARPGVRRAALMTV